MNRAQEKAQRLLQIEQLLWAHPEGLTRAEIARRLDVNRSTITKYLDKDQLPPSIYEDDLDGNKLKIDRSSDLTKASFNLHEVLAIHLATRLLATRTDKQNPHAASALRKLGKALQRLDHNVSSHLLRSADAMDEAAVYRDPVYLDVLQKLTEAWSSGRKVAVSHQMEDGRVFRYTFSPYLIEPYAVGQTAHVIGLREPPGAVRTFKIERLKAAEILTETYEIPQDFDADILLRNAWGIWYTESDPVEVVLKFHPRVAARVQESRWHQSEQSVVESDGSLLWRAWVAEPQEMLPWIRGWGAEVEVLGPVGLREELTKTMLDLGKVYQVTGSAIRMPYQLPYAKTDRKNPERIHLLLYHLIDVGKVAMIMWHEILTDGIRSRLAQILGLGVDECGQFLAFLVALHDLGKAGPAYQRKYAPRWLRDELGAAGLELDDPRFSERTRTSPHGVVTTWALDALLPEMLGLNERFAHQIAVALGGHHGIWPQPGATEYIRDDQHPAWEAVRRDLFWHLKGEFNPPSVVTPPKSTVQYNTFLTILSGLTSVADWVGSRNEERFGFVEQPISTRKYATEAVQKAREELRELGWTGWQPTGNRTNFAEAFAYLKFKEPRAVQQAVIDAALLLDPPTMLILEAPTGLGKTETALYLADCWLEQYKGRGLYVAMPTQATSNQMFGRTLEYLEHRYPKELVNLHLVHGQASWSDALKEIELQGVGDTLGEGVAAMAWFKPRKRTLLAPFGVGTVDQALMSILQTKHFFVRLFGLANKVVIFDEVHAYDTYMNTLFHRLLEWLNALGTSVIILSATLPTKTRQALVEAYTGEPLLDTDSVYPALTIANAQQPPKSIKLPEPKSYTLRLDWCAGRELANIVEFLRVELEAGGCAAIICNTVRRAQEVYRAIKQGNVVPDDELILFHSRFPPIWRMGIEKDILDKFGKGDTVHRPKKSIVVATQVIEQSLDIDFDLMITDLAPMDLVLQRAGRLHRHGENERYGLPRRLVIVEPEIDEKGLPDFDVDKFVYAPYVLLRSYLALSGRSAISLPGDTIELIEAVYSEQAVIETPSAAWQAALEAAWDKLNDEDRETGAKASRPLILEPSNGRMLKQNIEGLEEDDPTTHATFRAQTRDIDFSITVICLHRDGERVGVFGKDGKLITFNLEDELRARHTQALLQNALSIQHRGVGKHFVEQRIPQSWQNNAAMRYCRYAIFVDGMCEDIPGYTLYLNQEIGLQIVKGETV